MKKFALFFIALILIFAPAIAMAQVLKDSRGHTIGRIKNIGNREYIYDAQGHNLGYFDGRSTYDSRGHKIGDGNLLTMLLR